MNINNFKAAEFSPNWLEDIFNKQQALLDKYADIEGMPALPVNVNTREGQKWIKDFLWRVTEEMAESHEAIILDRVGDDSEKSEMHFQHRVEELIDALHFLVELIIIVGKDWKWAREQLDSTLTLQVENRGEAAPYWQVVYYLGLVGNTLKNKPWKQTEMPTDEEKFFKNLGLSFKALFACLAAQGQTEEKVFNFYSRKNQVNQFRQKSNY